MQQKTIWTTGRYYTSVLHLLSPRLRRPAPSYSCSLYWPSYVPSLFWAPGVGASVYSGPDPRRLPPRGLFSRVSSPTAGSLLQWDKWSQNHTSSHPLQTEHPSSKPSSHSVPHHRATISPPCPRVTEQPSPLPAPCHRATIFPPCPCVTGQPSSLLAPTSQGSHLPSVPQRHRAAIFPLCPRVTEQPSSLSAPTPQGSHLPSLPPITGQPSSLPAPRHRAATFPLCSHTTGQPAGFIKIAPPHAQCCNSKHLKNVFLLNNSK